MPQHSDRVRLKTGAPAESVVIHAPNLDWADRLESMMRHKGEPWVWQNSELLRKSTGADATFFVLHRDGEPFSNIMLVRSEGVGLLGHVWTAVSDRRSGASSVLMDRLLEYFQQNGGEALYLGTEFDSPPWHYYRRRGFAPVEPGSGYMEFYPSSQALFESKWFGGISSTVIEPLDWSHWVASIPLFIAPFDGVVRNAATQLHGRRVSEEALLSLLREGNVRRSAGQPQSACVLRADNRATILGLASWKAHPLWPATVILDVYCHPSWWHRATDLLRTLPVPHRARKVAYADVTQRAKCALLDQEGFAAIGMLPRWVASAPTGPYVDVMMFSKEAEDSG